jgi:ADP-ribose pyrophosphatase
MPVPPPSNAKKVWDGDIIDVWTWEQSMFDGSTSTFECITRPDTASVIAFLDPDTVLLTRQQQPHKPEPFIDFPGGRIDTGEDPQMGALRELQEETGHRAGRVMEWSRYAQRGISRFEEFLYVATDVTDGHPLHHDVGERIELLPTPWKDVVDLCRRRQMRQLNTMLAILTMEYDPEVKKRLRDWLRG